MNAGDKLVAMVPFVVLIVVLTTIAYRAHMKNWRARVAAASAPAVPLRTFPKGVRTAEVVFRCECCGQAVRQLVTAFEQDWVCGACKLVLTEAGAS